jgi:DNA primase
MAQRQVDIERIRLATDIVDLVGEHLSLKRSGSGMKGLCPFHAEKTPSFHVNPALQIFKCFGCGAGGDVFKFIQLRENVDFREALGILAARAGIDLAPSYSGDQASGPDRPTLARANQWAAQWFQAQYQHAKLGARARAYVAARRINDETVARFGLGFAPDSFDLMAQQAAKAKIPPAVLSAAGLTRSSESGRIYATFRDRLMFPIRDSSRRIIGFGGRALGEDPAKYLNTPETPLFNKGRELFGLEQARESISGTGRAVVTEGYTDCLMAHQFGFANTVASLGTSFTPEQARLLHRFCDEVVLVFDSDEAGRKAADRALEAVLAECMTVRVVNVPPGQDPCDFLLSDGKEAFAALLDSAVEALEFKWRQVREQAHASKGLAERRRAINDYLGLIARLAGRHNLDAVQLGIIVDRVAKLLSLPADRVQEHLAKLRPKQHGPSRNGGAAPREQGTPEARGPLDVAVREITEVLLNAPQHYEAVEQYLDPQVVTDPRLRRIVLEFRSAMESEQGYDFTGFLSAFQEPELTALITDLRIAGERRGNYASSLQGALQRLKVERAQHGPEADDSDSPESAASRMARVQQRSHDRRHFARMGRDVVPEAASMFEQGAALERTS